MFANKTLIDFTSLFFPYEFKKKMIKKFLVILCEFLTKEKSLIIYVSSGFIFSAQFINFLGELIIKSLKKHS